MPPPLIALMKLCILISRLAQQVAAALLAGHLMIPAVSAASDIHQLRAQALTPSTSLSSGQTFWQSTFFLDARQGSELSARANALRTGGFETATGNWITFARWY